MFLNLARDLLIFSFVLLACLPINIFSKSAQEIYDDGCAVCHDSGLAGAPMIGIKVSGKHDKPKAMKCLLIMPTMELMVCQLRAFVQIAPRKK